MSKFQIFAFALIMAAAISTATWWWSTLEHEHAHVIINSYYGVDSEATVYFDGWIGGRTQHTEPFKDKESYLGAYAGHSVNEAVGYQLKPFYFVLLFFICFGVLYGTLTNLGDY